MEPGPCDCDEPQLNLSEIEKSLEVLALAAECFDSELAEAIRNLKLRCKGKEIKESETTDHGFRLDSISGDGR
jgi:hypothetical protein